MRTIGDFEQFLQPVDSLISKRFIPLLFGMDHAMPNMQDIFSLAPSKGGLGLKNLMEEAKLQFTCSRMFTKIHVESIAEQNLIMPETTQDGKRQEDLRKDVVSHKANHLKAKTEQIHAQMDNEHQEDVKLALDRANDKGSSSWLSALPIEDQGFVLSKGEFRDALRMRYGISLEHLPSFCACGNIYSVKHAMSCKTGGFISMRHDGIKNFLTHLLSKVCKDVQSEPHLQPVRTDDSSFCQP